MGRYQGRGLADSIVPPAVWHGEASLSARDRARARQWPRDGGSRVRPYTPAVRPWDEPDEFEPEAVAPPSRRRRLILGALAVLVVATVVAGAWPSTPGPVAPASAAATDPETVTVLAGQPSSIDPAKHGDLGSAAFV